jgi:predicted ATPase
MADGITRIAVEGFKSIVNRQEIEIAPLTILAGANSSGKSSIMQPLLMLKQTLEAPYDPGPLLINGPHVMFTSADQFLAKTSLEGHLVILIGTQGWDFEIVLTKGVESGMEVVEESRTVSGKKATLRPNMPSDEIRQEMGDLFNIGSSVTAIASTSTS